MTKKTKRLIFCLFLIVLPVVQFLIFYVAVNINSLRLAFVNIDGQKETFVAFGNFAKVFKEMATVRNWSKLFPNSVLVWLLGLVTKLPLTIVISFFIYKTVKIGRAIEIVLFFPSVISVMATVMLYEYFVSEGFSEILSKITNKPVSGFFEEPKSAFISVFMYGFWCGFGTSLLLYVNAMRGISESVVEAAKLDGASEAQEFLHVTLPMIFPTIKTLLVIGIASIFTNQFNLYEFYGIENAPTDIQTVGYYLFQQTMVSPRSDYPKLAALGLVISAITIPLTLVVRLVLNKFDPMEEM